MLRPLFIAVLLTSALCIELSSPRVEMAAASVSYQTALAGGRIGDEPSDSIDLIFGGSARKSSYRLSEARYRLTGASAGSVMAFAGGRGSAGLSATIDIFNTTLYNWTTSVASLSQPSDEVIGVGVDSVILFAQPRDNDTLVDMFDLASMRWSNFSLPHRCWRAGVRKGRLWSTGINITLLCEAGLWILNVTARTWSLAAFTRPIDSPHAAQIKSLWLKQESAVMQYAALSLLSLCDLRDCYPAAATTSTQIAFVSRMASIIACTRDELQVFTGDSAVSLRSVGTLALLNPRINSTYGAQYGSGSDFVVIAGGLCVSLSRIPAANPLRSLLNDSAVCNSYAFRSVNVDLFDLSLSHYSYYGSKRCQGNPQDPSAYCGDRGWVLSSDMTVAAGSTFTLPYPAVINASLTLAPGASLVIPEGATLVVTNALYLSPASSMWLYGSNALRTEGNVDLGANFTLYVRNMISGWSRWIHAGPTQRLSFPLTVDVAGDMLNDATVPIIDSALYNRPLLVSAFHLRDSGVRFTSQLQRLSRYACPEMLALSIPRSGRLLLSNLSESPTCGLGRDLLLIVAACVTLGALVLWAVRGALTPPPFSEPAPLLEKEETCSICLQDCEKPVVLRCRHRYCEACIEEWAKARNTCPICRQSIRAGAQRPVHSRLINFYIMSCYALLLLVAVSWLYFSANFVVGEVLVILLGFALMSVVPMLATSINAFGREMDESSPHESGVPWAALMWHVLVPLFAVPLFLLSFSAMQLRYAGFFHMASLPCVDAPGSICLDAKTVNPVGCYSWTLPLANGTVLSLQQGGLASAMEAVGVAVAVVVCLSVLMLAVTVVHGVCVLRYPASTMTQFVARSSLPVLCFLSLLALIASAVCARVTHVFRGYETGDQTWLQEGASLMRVVLLLASLQLVVCLPTAVRGLRSSAPPPAAQRLGDEESEPGVPMRRLDAEDVPVAGALPVSEEAPPAVPPAPVVSPAPERVPADSEEGSDSSDRRPLLQSADSAQPLAQDAESDSAASSGPAENV